MINIKIDSPDEDIKAAIAVLIRSKLLCFNIPITVSDSIDKDKLVKTIYSSVLTIENKTKTEEVTIHIS